MITLPPFQSMTLLHKVPKDDSQLALYLVKLFLSNYFVGVNSI